jgi:Cu(I)/Ag(I) efflux system protein CusF
MRLASVAFLFLAAPAYAQGGTGAQGGMGAMSGMSTAPEVTKTAEGVGLIKAINAKAGTITIKHDPIKALGWPAMTMTFKTSAALVKDFKAGQKVKFAVRVGGGNQELTALQSN